MRSRFRSPGFHTILCLLALLILPVTVSARSKRGKAAQRSQAPLDVRVTNWGPGQSIINQTTTALPDQPALRRYLQGTRYRLLDFQLIETNNNETAPPDGFQATYYDYTNNRTVRAEGKFGRLADLIVSFGNDQPVPSVEEFQAAIDLLSTDGQIGPALRSGLLTTNPAMPPVIYPDSADSPVERTVNVLLLPSAKSQIRTEIVGVNMISNRIVHYPGGAPPTGKAAPEAACGIPNAGQATTSSGTAGQYQFVISQNGVELWRFLAIRPSASSGQSDRSGIELQNVMYKGKMVLKRIHTPILNVSYDGNICGPFRDWQWQEGMFQADGTDVPGTNNGVRDCGTTQATTALDTGNDTGNFRGIAFYRQGSELVLVTEMNAGWYRYICEYGFDNNGTIRPRYGYGATDNSCVCFAHTHNVYWRFDFDIGGNGSTPAVNVIRPSRREFTWGPAYTTETRLQRTLRVNWLVQNPTTLDAYMIRPNRNDGTAAAGSYGRGDLWALVYKSNEISDRDAGLYTGTPANIDGFMSSPESLVNQDIVVWYAGHFYHDDASNRPGSESRVRPETISGDHVHGPDLVPVHW